MAIPKSAALGSLLVQALSLATAVAVWQALVHFSVYRFSYIPSVPQVLAAAFEYLPSARFAGDLWSSTYRVLIAWLLALTIGVPLGLLIGWRIAVRDMVFPAVELLRPVPPIAWIPAAIAFFPYVEASVVFICFVGGFFPILLNTVTGARQIDETYFRAARCCGASEGLIFRRVVLYGAMPYIVIGAAVSMGICWMAVVAAEMIAGEHGLGYMIWEAYSLAQYPRIIVGMFIIGALGAGMSRLIRDLGRLLVPWQKS